MIERLEFIGNIDSNRLRRAKELSELKVRMIEAGAAARFGIHSKSLIVLSYAHWEGFYNECVYSYINALKECGKKVGDISWPLLIGLVKPELQRLRDRNHSNDAQIEFLNRLQPLLDGDFTGFDESVISSRSNLDFQKLSQNFMILGFDLTPFQRWRLRIDRELVGWRHSVAHGDDPDLSSLDLHRHIEFTQKLLLLLADVFQEGILSHDNQKDLKIIK